MDTARLYLAAPQDADAATLAARLNPVLDAAEVSALLLDPAGPDEGVARLADAAREIAHARDIPVVIADRVALAERLGLDGVHLTGGRDVRDARETLGADAIVGAHAGASRHDGLTAGEAGADYVAFGPMGGAAEERAALDLFAWWSEMIEVPLVAEGGLDEEVLRALAPHADFVTLGPEIWVADDPVRRLGALLDALRG